MLAFLPVSSTLKRLSIPLPPFPILSYLCLPIPSSAPSLFVFSFALLHFPTTFTLKHLRFSSLPFTLQSPLISFSTLPFLLVFLTLLLSFNPHSFPLFNHIISYHFSFQPYTHIHTHILSFKFFNLLINDLIFFIFSFFFF